MLQINKEVTAEAVTAMSEPPAETGLFSIVWIGCCICIWIGVMLGKRR